MLVDRGAGRADRATRRSGSARGEMYLADEHPEFEGVVGPETLGGTSVTIDLEVDDVDAASIGRHGASERRTDDGVRPAVRLALATRDGRGAPARTRPRRRGATAAEALDRAIAGDRPRRA